MSYYTLKQTISFSTKETLNSSTTIIPRKAIGQHYGMRMMTCNNSVIWPLDMNDK